MVDILSCKLYLASSRKKEILGAIQDPTNQELVSQMKKYLDDEFIDPKYLEQDANVSDDNSTGSSTEGEDNRPQRRQSRPTGGKFHKSSGGFMPGEHYESDDDVSEEGEASGSESLDNSSDELDDAVDSAVAIKASSAINRISIDALKGTFNSREDCVGVSRVAVKDSELWIYYNDDINLNNVMTAVVDLVSELGMTYLEFNRLARSNNAIVFDIITATDSAVEAK